MTNTATARKACSTTTLWGRADDSRQLTRGVVWYTTPGHGGLGVSLAWAAQNLTPAAQELGERQYGRLWYEEDCLCSIVFYEHPELDMPLGGTERTMEEIRESNAWAIRKYFARYFDPEFQRTCGANPISPALRVGDVVTLTSRSFQVIQVRPDDYLVYENNAGPFRLRKAAVMETATRVIRDGVMVWRRVSDSWGSGT
jgi:hypothetical protein